MARALIERQNPDGGWSFQPDGSSWTEPTCYALLALIASGVSASDAVRRGVAWISSRQRSDGGWAPRDGVEASTWVTALAMLLPADNLHGIDRARAVSWLTGATGRESGFWQRLRQRLLDVPVDPAQAYDGWPWFPDATAWVMPTALSILALRKLERGSTPDSERNEIRSRIRQGERFLLARRCRDGGWNHGSTQALGYDSDSYPETTGVALLAMRNASPPAPSGALDIAELHLQTSRSLEASSWLTLALGAWGRRISTPVLKGNGRTIEIALGVLTQSAAEGRNAFTE
jgi:hypothetical protein